MHLSRRHPGWLDWYAGPTKPRFKLPAGAVDAHCHVFGPGAEFPVRARAQIHALRCVEAQLFALRDHLGFARNVDRAGHLSWRRQPRAWSMRCAPPAAGRAAWPRCKRDVTDAELQALHEAGVRGVRFNFVKRLVDFTPQGRVDGDRRPHRASWAGTS